MTAINNPHVVTDLFNAFAEAQKAMTELPQVRAEHSALVERYEGLEHLHHTATETLQEREAEITNLKATLAAKEAALSAATFRESELRAKHSALRSLLADGLDTSRPEPTGQSVNNPIETSGSNKDQTPETGLGESTQQGKSDMDPTSTDASTSPGQLETAPVSSATSIENVVAEGQSEVDPTFEQHPTGTQPTDGALDSDKSHTSKPASMFWGEWLATGGSPPPWMSPDAAQAHIDAHHNPYTTSAAE